MGVPNGLTDEQQSAFRVLRDVMDELWGEDRVELIDALRKGYCSDCGKAEGQYPCRCTDDD